MDLIYYDPNGGSPMTQFIRSMRSVCCSLLFISAACGLSAVFGSGLKTYQPQAADTDNLREVLKKARSAAEGIKSFRIRVEAPTVNKGCTTDCAYIYEYASPDSYRLILGKVEMIGIGKDVYFSGGGSSWKKFTKPDKGESKSESPARTLNRYIETVEKADEVKFIGREDVDGIPALVYEHTKYYGPDKSRPNTEKIWFSEADGSLLRNQIYCVVTGSTPSSVNYTFYDYNADIKIEPPTEYVSIAAPDNGAIAGGGIAFTVAIPDSAEPYLGKDKGIGTGKGGGTGSGDGTGRGSRPTFITGGVDPSLGGGTRSNMPATSVDQKPVPLNAPRPNYTEAARNNKIQGIVRVKVLVGADGGVKQVKVTSGLPDGLNEQAIYSAYQYRFKPAMKNGQAVSYWVGVDIEFNLR